MREELKNAMQEHNFSTLFDEYHQKGEWKEICPLIEDLWSSPENPLFHPEGNTGGHTYNALRFLDEFLKRFPQHSEEMIYLSVLFHDVGKAHTDKQFFPKHHEHDTVGFEQMTKVVQQQMELDDETFSFLKIIPKHHMRFWKWFDMADGHRTDMLLDITGGKPVLEAKQRVETFLLSCVADHYGRPSTVVNWDLAYAFYMCLVDDVMTGYPELISADLTEHQKSKIKKHPELYEKQLRLNRILKHNDVRKNDKCNVLDSSFRGMYNSQLREMMKTPSEEYDASKFELILAEHNPKIDLTEVDCQICGQKILQKDAMIIGDFRVCNYVGCITEAHERMIYFNETYVSRIGWDWLFEFNYLK